MDSVPYQPYKVGGFNSPAPPTHSPQSKRHSRTFSAQPSPPPSRPPSSASSPKDPNPVNDDPPPSEPSSPTSTSSGSSPQPLSLALHAATSSESFPIAGSSVVAPAPTPAPKTARKTSTFRRIPLREARPTIPSSPLRSSHLQPPSAPSPTQSPLRLENELPALTLEPPAPATQSPVEPIRSPSPPPPKPPPKTPTSDPPTPRALSPQSRPTSAPPAPRPSTRFYRPGFQPKGVYRPRTDQFFEARKAKRDSGRIETTRLERRLEKLITLHFSDPPEKPIQAPPIRERRSSFFEMDFSDLRNKSAGELWKGVLQSQAPGGKGDLRASEQKISPWEEDSSVSQCPLCLASFHPITNRKHHCRLCGRIICSLPAKLPQRPVTCSLLFVADPKTGKIEEVGEGVDYGVRRRTVTQSQGPVPRGKPPQPSDDDKFLKGVRICRDCRPVLLRQQYMQEATTTPVFFKLYELFVGVEREIEDALPQFQELILSLKNDEQPTAEASAARKRLLDAFTQYDTLAKRIRKLPCPSGPGSSQDRIQTAILTRANIFLQKNMFPLQSLPKPAKRSTSASSTPSQVPLLETSIDPDSELAHALQPLLEQEALLETFVQEAKSHRKFEDVQTLKANLVEIRSEIDRIVANADRNRKSDFKGKQRQ